MKQYDTSLFLKKTIHGLPDQKLRIMGRSLPMPGSERHILHLMSPTSTAFKFSINKILYHKLSYLTKEIYCAAEHIHLS
jgi:hypothetical protein